MATFASLSSITCPGSLGIISAYPEGNLKILHKSKQIYGIPFSGVRTPFEMSQSYGGCSSFHNKNFNFPNV
jgi:hypothetical protein